MLRYLSILMLLPSSLLAQGSSPTIHADFPGGSIQIEKLEGNALTFSPATRPNRGWVCWWYFQIKNLKPGDTFTFTCVGGGFALPDQAAYSLDNKTWKQTAPGKRVKDRVTYEVKAESDTVWLAWGPPFQLADAKALVERVAKASPFAKAIELCKSKGGRDVPGLVITEGDAKGKVGIWIHARQHAWESGSSWVCQGLVDWLVSDDPAAVALRKKAVIYIVPIMDVDNVEIGAGGKNQDPHDHNRDWFDGAVWNESKAAMERIDGMIRRKEMDLFIDLHNPGPNDRQPFFFTPDVSLLKAESRNRLDTFLAATRAEMKGALQIAPKSRESGSGYDKNWKRISANWVAEHGLPHTVACCLETSWNTPQSNQAGYLHVGEGLGKAVARFFAEPRSEK